MIDLIKTIVVATFIWALLSIQGFSSEYKRHNQEMEILRKLEVGQTLCKEHKGVSIKTQMSVTGKWYECYD